MIEWLAILMVAIAMTIAVAAGSALLIVWLAWQILDD